jgi:hypothetical protein
VEELPMLYRTLGLSLLMSFAAFVAVPAGGQDCMSAKPAIVSGAVPRALGKSPIWVTAESIPIKWTDPAVPVQLIWIIDAEAREPYYVSGRHRVSGVPIKFTKIGDRVGMRQPRWRLDPLGFKPAKATPKDIQKYTFDRTFAWFTAGGCYEIRGQARNQETVILVQVGDK